TLVKHSLGKENKFTLELSDSKWNLEQGDPSRDFSEQRFQDWFTEFKKIKGTKVWDEKKDLKAQTPLVFRFNEDYLVEFFKGKDVFFIKDSAHPRIIEIPAERLKRVLVPKSYFYDHEKPFRFPLEQV